MWSGQFDDTGTAGGHGEAARIDVGQELGSDEEVDAVGLVGEGVDLIEQGGKGGDGSEARAGSAEHAQTASVGDRRRQGWGGDGTHAGLLDRDGAAH